METRTPGAMPGPLTVRWGAVALGALFALGAQVLVGRVEAALAAEPGGTGGFVALGMIAAFFVPLLGALVAVRAAALANVRGAYLHGLAALCLFLLVSALLGAGAPWPWAGRVIGDELARAAASGWVALAALLTLAGTFVGSALARRQVLGQPAFRRSDFVPAGRGFDLKGLRRLGRRKAAAEHRDALTPRESGDEPRPPIH